MKVKKFEYFIEPCYDYIGEGIDIDYKNKKVKINLEHENGIDTSILNNHLYNKVNNYDVISIFTRKKYQRSDGNPLLYSLKCLNGWSIDKYDISLLLKQFIKICDKIDPVYDTIIKIPSGNELNNIFMDRINNIIKCENKISNLLTKLEADMVWMDGVDFKSMNSIEIEDLESDFMKMSEFFSFKSVRPNLRKYIKKIYDDNWIGVELDVADKINNKNILILDDTISSGQTISLFTERIMDIYEPKKVTIITLFSKLK
jgi:hypothetical protein